MGCHRVPWGAVPSPGEELAPTWPKAVYRRGVALRGLRRYDMAISAFAQGLEQDAWRSAGAWAMAMHGLSQDWMMEEHGGTQHITTLGCLGCSPKAMSMLSIAELDWLTFRGSEGMMNQLLQYRSYSRN